MATDAFRILAIHGLGDHRGKPWADPWKAAIERVAGDVPKEFHFATYDPIFEQTELSALDTAKALGKLAISGLSNAFRRERGVLSGVSEKVRWTAGYVVAWVEDDAFQAETRKWALDLINAFKPNIILAHSLGSLITYNALGHPDAQTHAGGETAMILRDAHYVTLGSQIGNPFVVGNLTHGRVEPLPVRHWHHLYNEHDDVFTAKIRMPGVPNFTQLLTPFDMEGSGDHAADGYLGHPVTAGSFWRPLAAAQEGSRGFGAVSDPWSEGAGTRKAKSSKAKPETAHRKRALLVGINAYPNPADRLEGCVNDVFTMSAVLQECGFAPEDIRICLDERATAAGIMERLEWLLDDARGGDQRVFYYSGHGARMPQYGEDLEPDRRTETLVPWDFDWTSGTAITDDHIYGLYSQLPYDLQLALIFDCCHSGGVHRQGGAKARGISPPDDIRHRELKWDFKTQMWVERDFERLNAKFSTTTKANKDFFGDDGASVRLGRASMLRRDTEAGYRAARKKDEKAIVGPYLPLIIEACAEHEKSYEYRHGVTSYGAFTFCLASLLRELKTVSFEDLTAAARARLKDLGYAQAPQSLGPTKVVKADVPWMTGRTHPGPGSTPGVGTPRLSG